MGDFLREDAVPEGWITGELNPDQTRSDSLWGWAHSSPEWFHESKTASLPGTKSGAADKHAGKPTRLHVICQTAGQGIAIQGQWETHLASGDCVILMEEGEAPLSNDHGRQLRFHFPLHGLSAAQREVLQQLPIRLSGNHPATVVLKRVAADLHLSLEQLPPQLAALFTCNLLNMLAGTLASLQPEGEETLTRLKRFHLNRIKAYLKQHLRDPELSVRSVAQALGMSTSHLHRVFLHEGRTVSDWLWNERLEACAADLSSLSEAQRPVGDIALSWGFNDLSHFSRVFKKRFGVSPRQWRSRTPWHAANPSSVSEIGHL